MGFILFSPGHTFMPITEICFSRILLKIIGIISFLFTVIKECPVPTQNSNIYVNSAVYDFLWRCRKVFKMKTFPKDKCA